MSPKHKPVFDLLKNFHCFSNHHHNSQSIHLQMLHNRKKRNDNLKVSVKGDSIIAFQSHVSNKVQPLEQLVSTSGMLSTLQLTSFPMFWVPSNSHIGTSELQASINRMSKVWGCICHTFRAAYSSKHSFN